MPKRKIRDEDNASDDSDNTQMPTSRHGRRPHSVKIYKPEDYEPLPKGRGMIRLLKLLPNEDPNSEVQCELETPVKCEDCVREREERSMKEKCDSCMKKGKDKYEAVSWCWGTGTWDASIKIRANGVHYEKKISPNLLAALQALRYTDRDRYLWIDAICINVSQLQFNKDVTDPVHPARQIG